MKIVRQPLASRPDAHDVLEYAFEGRTERVPRVRDLAREKLSDHLAAWPDLIEDITLVLTELVSNAIRHSHSGDGGQVTVSIRVGEGPKAWLEVSDEGSDTTPALHTASPGATGGRGLQVVDALADDWGVRAGRRPMVWAIFAPARRT